MRLPQPNRNKEKVLARIMHIKQSRRSRRDKIENMPGRGSYFRRNRTIKN